VPEDHDVYLNILIHRRSGLLADYDLLMVEVKKEESLDMRTTGRS